MPGRRSIYTLGTGRRSEEDFIEIILAYDIRTVVDVRSFPKSKMPHFNGPALREMLGAEGLGYVWMGPSLGGFRRGGFEAYTSTGEFMQGIDALEAEAAGVSSAVLCAERLPWKCHRRWIARELGRRGWLVEHILEKGRLWTPAH